MSFYANFILYCLKHLLRHRFLILLFNLRLCLPELFHPFQFFLGIIKPDMRIDIHRDWNIRMSHEVLQCLWIHSRFCHIGTIGVTAHMRRDVRYLHPVDIVVPAYHMIESVLPVHCHKWHIIFIIEKESSITINNLFDLRRHSVLNDCLKHLCYILRNREFPRSGIRFCGFNDIPHI